MNQYIIRRFLMVIVILWSISLVVFFVTEILPGDTATFILGQRATPENLAALRNQLGLNQPIHQRYIAWITGLLQGDWGNSLLLKMPVLPILIDRLYNTAILAGLALLVGIPLGIFLGIIAGLNRGSWLDQLVLIVTILTVSLPSFVIAIFLVIIFAAWLQWLPASSLVRGQANLMDNITVLILPTLTLVFEMLAHITRHTRSSLIEVLDSDYLRTAKSKGLSQHLIILRHALPNALLPTISIIALNVGWLLSGAVLVETVFAYPGLGRLMLQAISSRDIPLLQAITLVMAIAFTLANLVADLLYMWLNPQIRYSL